MYQVIMQDEYNKLFNLGFYKELNDSLEDVNDFLSVYEEVEPLYEIQEYPSSFCTAFDKEINDKNDEPIGVMIRGFKFEDDYLKKI